MNDASPNSDPTRGLRPRCFALIPCAGTGSRAGEGPPKQYRAVAGQALVWHTLAAFLAVPRITHTLLVVSPGDGFFDGHAAAGWSAQACGGATRAHSVGNGLQALAQQGALPHDWVLVHDAARCLVTPAQIHALIAACETDAVGGLLAQPLPDTLKSAAGGRVAQTIDRSDKWLAQTPQMFRLGDLAAAYAQVGALVTDEASAIEATGRQPLLVPGGAQNFKVTYPDDFVLAEAVLRSRQ